MPREEIESNILRVLNTVEGIGQIGTTNPRWIEAMRDTDIVRIFTDIDTLTDPWNFWLLERSATLSDDDGTAPGRVAIGSQLRKLHTFRLEGYCPVVYEGDYMTNGPDFQNLVDRVIDAFDNEPALGGFDSQPVQLRSFATGMALGRLCFRAMIDIAVLEIASVRRTNW